MMKRLVIIASLVLAISGCGSAPPPGTTDVTLTGAVSAPGGTLAAMRPSGIRNMLADALFGSKLNALSTGWISVGGGVSVKLLEVDSTGVVVSTLVTATTNSDGSYELVLPDGFIPGPKYVVRVGTDTVYVETRIPVASGTLDVNPGSQAASDLVTDIIAALSAQLSDLSADELQQLMDEAESAMADIDFSAYTDIAGFSGAILNAVKDDQDRANVLYSSISSGSICGTVTDSNTTALANIIVVARDYGNWVTRAKAKTDASGNYCINLPKAGDTDPFTGNIVTGEYILGAINRTGTSFAASEWWTSGGGSNNQYSAEKVTVSAVSTGETADFELLATGARVSGTVQGYDGVYADGVNVLLREYDTFKPVVSARVKADGSFRVNVKPGDYLISYRNRTNVHPYASEVYNNKHQRNQADKVTVVAGANGPYDATLDAGGLIKGTVYTDSGRGTVATGTIVSIVHPNLSGTVERMRTNKKGKFRYWAQNATDNPNGYTVNARGRTKQYTALTAASTGQAFDADVATITGVLIATDASGNAVPGTKASELFVRVSPIVGTNVTGYISQDSAAEDGSFTVYVDGFAGDGTTAVNGYALYARADSQLNYGSGVYSSANVMNKTAYGSALAIIPTVGMTTDLGNIRVPTLGDNVGVGYLDGDAGMAAEGVKIGVGGVNNATRFMTTASRGDGSFKVSLPVGVYYVYRNVYNGDGTLNTANGAQCTAVSIVNGATTNVTFGSSTSTSCTTS